MSGIFEYFTDGFASNLLFVFQIVAIAAFAGLFVSIVSLYAQGISINDVFALFFG